ncbi:MAG: hypothetical protein M3Y51_07815 [Actinomycetota bacterium]|nr:hypothetical protein [Actinomycetota bacterium]
MSPDETSDQPPTTTPDTLAREGERGAGQDDSGRETQPSGEDSVERSARTVERLERQSRSFDDAAGINPDRGQDSTPPPDEADHE